MGNWLEAPLWRYASQIFFPGDMAARNGGIKLCSARLEKLALIITKRSRRPDKTSEQFPVPRPRSTDPLIDPSFPPFFKCHPSRINDRCLFANKKYERGRVAVKEAPHEWSRCRVDDETPLKNKSWGTEVPLEWERNFRDRNEILIEALDGVWWSWLETNNKIPVAWYQRNIKFPTKY